MKRRDFLTHTALAASGAMVWHSASGAILPVFERDPLDELFNGFQDPPGSARLFVRWWWNGNRLKAEEILRELDVLKAAGIGGVEINPIAFPGGPYVPGYEPLTMFEPKWLDMLQIALQGAKERGITCDMIVGSGWPFGGEFLKKDDQTQMVTIETLDLEGGNSYSFRVDELLDKVSPHFHSANKSVFKDMVTVRLVPKHPEEFAAGTELIDRIHNGVLNFDVPEGDFVLYYVVKLTGYMAVINGAPGAAGPVLNHYSKQAAEDYLNRISGFITGKIGHMGDYIRAMFCDSMELEGANWNDDLPAEFEKRRGYPLWPYLPFVLKKVGHMGNPVDEEYGARFPAKVLERLRRVDLDYYRTRIELFKERFIDTFNDWCHRNGVKSRMQAYGRGMHPLEASMEVDIPESETWMFREVGREYPDTGLEGRAPRMCNKFVSSGAALAGKRVVSCEEITNTAMAFMATLENIKVAGDQSNISGVTHSILHGFNYTPLEAPFPGWIRYGAFFNERNTWWPYFRQWSDYKARLSYLFQNAVPRADVAILQPLTDLWLKMGPQRDPFPQKWYPEYQHNLWEAVHQNGGGCDYVSENIIRKSTFRDGRMWFNGRNYHTVLLPEIETLDAETAHALSTFADQGGRVVFIGKKPFQSPAYQNREAADAEISGIIDALMNKERVSLYPAPDGDLIKWYGELQDKLGIRPYVKLDRTDKFLSQVSYQVGENTLFFIANSSLSEPLSIQAEFQVGGRFYPWIWNPEDGTKRRYPAGKDGKTIRLELPHATSLLIVFEKAKGKSPNPAGPEASGMAVAGPWTLHLNHMNGDRQQLVLETLQDLVKDERTRHFAGEVIYEKTIVVTDTGHTHIDLGDVQGVSELTLNGQNLGTRWYGAHVYPAGKALKKGENKLSVKLTTITGNYLKGLTDNPVAQGWTGRQDYYPMGVMGPVRLV